MASGEKALLTGKGERRGRFQPGKPGRGAHRQLLLLLVLAIRQGLTSDDGSHGWLFSAVAQPLQDIRLHNAISVTQQFRTSMRDHPTASAALVRNWSWNSTPHRT